ncbi:MAG: hypothetical protein ACTSSP_10050 [Candidatus Asgardarchaeia archaeon]
MHYITKIIMNKIDEGVHREFVKYGRGEFEGPVLQVNISKNKVTFSGSFGYESLLMDIFVRNLEECDYKISGKIYSHKDYTDFLRNFGIQPMKSKELLYEVKVETILNKEKLKELISKMLYEEYLFLTITPLDKKVARTLKITCKTSFPKPSKSSADVSVALDFVKLIVPPSEEINSIILNEIAPDFKDKITDINKFTLRHKIVVTKLEIPPEYKDSSASIKRQKAIRIGKLIRTIEFDDSKYKIEYSFKA